jgi:hypothetical protein
MTEIERASFLLNEQLHADMKERGKFLACSFVMARFPARISDTRLLEPNTLPSPPRRG